MEQDERLKEESSQPPGKERGTGNNNKRNQDPMKLRGLGHVLSSMPCHVKQADVHHEHLHLLAVDVAEVGLVV